jgi:acrylyl-CoA reductase (NADPH)
MRAFVAEQSDDGVDRGLRDLDTGDLGEGDVLVKIAWSSVNYKDALATIPKGGVARISPLVPGIDLAGTVEDTGEEVLAHGYDLGVAHHGGFAEYARVPADWIVPLPDGMTARQAMAIGTAGYTAALSVIALETAGVAPGDGPVLVTGAGGGLGSTAVDILAKRGYEVVASSGKDPDWLKELGASDVISREEAAGDDSRPLEKARWAAAVDPVGGDTLAGVLRAMRYGGVVAAPAAPRGRDRGRDRARRARRRARRDPRRRGPRAHDRQGGLAATSGLQDGRRARRAAAPRGPGRRPRARRRRTRRARGPRDTAPASPAGRPRPNQAGR